MKIPQRDWTMRQRLNTSTTRKPRRRAKRWIRILVPYLILSGLLVVCVLSVCLSVLPIIVEEQVTKEVHITSQTPNNTPTAQITTTPTTSVQPTPQEDPEPALYTYDELYCMAVVIYNEAGGNEHTDEVRELVGYVVLNRVNDSRYPDSIRGVLEDPGQYAGLGSAGVHFAKRASKVEEADALERAWVVAKKVLENRNNIPIPETVVFQAEFKQGIGVYKQIGNMYFCYTKEAK